MLFYGKFVTEFDKPTIDYKSINLNRYVDWAITTPIMLLVLILADSRVGKLNLPNFVLIFGHRICIHN